MRRLQLLSLAVIATLLLTACAPIIQESNVLTIYTTFPPIYTLTKLVVGDAKGYNVVCLTQPQDECLRGYVLSDWDQTLLLRAADAVIAGGRGLEAFQEALEEMSEKSFPLVEAMAGMELLSFDITDEDSHFSGDNPHAYLSVKGCKQLLTTIMGALCALYPKDRTTFETNVNTVLLKFDAVETQIDAIKDSVIGAPVALLNEAALYTADELGLSVVCLIERESGEMYTDAGFELLREELEKSGAKIALLERQAPAALIEWLREDGIGVALIDTVSTSTALQSPTALYDALLGNAQAIEDAL